ncbi:immunoglobulin superfamily member 1-like [Macrotis lagotis]|uniref:immunoglobulin superfamily member 1-like n=1 Tax=Macrotis lagotis TaxID=92651 RepID=UPI003D689D23
MGPTVMFLLSIALLPRPTLWAVPSPVVPKGADVTLMSQGQLESNRFQLWKNGKPGEEKNASWELAEFVLRSVDDLKDVQSYSCCSRKGSLWSNLSEPLVLVVTRAFPEPSISVLPGSRITLREGVIICCKILQQMRFQDYTFALLEAKSLEPLQLQHPAGSQADFILPSVQIKDTWSYKCQLPKPTLWARPGLLMSPGANITLWCSRPKLSSLAEVTFTLKKSGTQKSFHPQTSSDLWTSFLLPSMQFEDAGITVVPTGKVPALLKYHDPVMSCSWWCQGPHRDKVKVFIPIALLRPVRPLSPGREEAFLLSPRILGRKVLVAMSWDLGGEFQRSRVERGLEGSLPKTSLTALPGLIVKPGTHVSLQCQLPPQSSLWGVTLMLLKVGLPQPLQSQSTVGTMAGFPLLSVRAQDAGNYSYVYHDRMTPHQVSEPSDLLEIWMTDALPKPSLLAWTGPGWDNVNFLCWGPSLSARFLLCKNGDEKISYSMDATHHGAQFSLNHVTPKDSGNYSCSYEVNTNGSSWTQCSDPLQLIVRDAGPRNTLIITLSCLSFLLFLLCLVLLMFLCHGSIATGSLQGDILRRIFVALVFHGLSAYPISLKPPDRKPWVPFGSITGIHMIQYHLPNNYR